MTGTDFLSDEQLLDVLRQSNDATAVHVGEDARIQYANNAMLDIWGKGKDVIGKPLDVALPELKGQPFIDMFKRVWNEGITVDGKDTAADLLIDGELKTFYFDFEYRAIKNDDGKTICILHMAKDVTDAHINAEKIQDLTEELRTANEELLSANEEIRAANEEIMASNEELNGSQRELQELYRDLSESNSYFRSMVKQAPVGICIIRADDLFVMEVNDAYLELVGRERTELDKRTIWEAIPEAAEAYAPVMNGVITTGVAFVAKDHELVLIRKGVPETVFIDFVYEPMLVEGAVQAIMVLAIEVSEKVLARRVVEETEERIRLAIEAAEIGTFDLDLKKGVMLTSDRFDAIFGFDEHADWSNYPAVIHRDDQHIREKAHREAVITGKLFYEVRVVYSNESIHWIRVQGQVYYDDAGKAERILGTLLDITRFKNLEQQKDDFISIASHELKTPVTSLKASLQLLERLKGDLSSPLVPRLIDQSLKSMTKISTLIEDLLNVNRTKESQFTLKRTTFVVADLLEACCNHIRMAGKYNLTIEGDKYLTIFADEHAIDQVVVNFVNNAVKYAPGSLEIFLKIEAVDGAVKISVRDTGPGVAESKIPYLFDRYYQAESSGFNKSGLGLGLYISAEIIRKHGGQIGVNSVKGEGSTFWFTIPQ
jgi:PAS domain S-box-containing protein